MKEDIKDTEIRIIGKESTKKKVTLWRWIVPSVIVLGILAALPCYFVHSDENLESEIGIFEQIQLASPQSHPLHTWLASLDSIQKTVTISKDTTINDIPLRIYVPLNSIPHLEVGYHVVDNYQDNILFFQAADIRADNKKIVGAFVLHGEPLSWGLSKQGYCSIIDEKITIGVASNSPLFEEATEKDGDFFRQYPLVSNGNLVENELKTKSIRRSLCELEGRVVVIESQTTESLHDFAQALVDIGTTNAIYLVGADAIGWACDLEGNGTKIGAWEQRAFKNISFIVWNNK